MLQPSQKIFVVDSFIKFWSKDCVDSKEVTINKSTIMFYKNSIPIFKDTVKFIVTDSFVKN